MYKRYHNFWKFVNVHDQKLHVRYKNYISIQNKRLSNKGFTLIY